MFNWNIFQHHDARIFLLETDESSENLLHLLQNQEVYLPQFQVIKHEKRKREFLSARIGINILMQNKVEIDYKDNGQPFLKNNDYQISISHSGPYIALICHPFASVGIDIEIPSEKIAKVVTRFLSEKERVYLNDKNAWAIAWSAKEAAYKILGPKATDFSDSLEIEPFIPLEKGELFLNYWQEQRKFTLNYELTENYSLVYCIDNN